MTLCYGITEEDMDEDVLITKYFNQNLEIKQKEIIVHKSLCCCICF